MAAATNVSRLSEGLLKDIRLKKMAPGSRIPSYRKLATRFGVSLPTVQRAIALLEQGGYLRTAHGSGTYVTERVQSSGVPSSRSSVVIAAFPFQHCKPELLLGIQKEALSKGLLFTQWFSDQFAQNLTFEQQLIDHARKERLRAILLFTSPRPPTNDTLFQEAKQKDGLRIIHLTQYKEEMENEEYVTPDFRRAGVAAATYLLRKGYSRFLTLVVGGTPDYFGRDIRKGFEETLRDQGIPSQSIQHILRVNPPKLPDLQTGTGIVSDSPYVLNSLVPLILKQKLRIQKDVGLVSCAENAESKVEFRFPSISFSLSKMFSKALSNLADDAPAGPCRIRVAPNNLIDAE